MSFLPVILAKPESLSSPLLFVIPVGNLLLSFSLVILAKPESLYWPLPCLSFRTLSEVEGGGICFCPAAPQSRGGTNRKGTASAVPQTHLYKKVARALARAPGLGLLCLSFPQGICFCFFRVPYSSQRVHFSNRSD